MRVLLVCALAAFATTLAFAGCNDLDVGRKCLSTSGGGGGGDGGVVGTKIGSPSLECMSRLCFQQGTSGTDRLYCTARCTTDEDCKGGLTSVGGKDPSLCGSSFVCAIATNVGDFACQQFCICKDDLVKGVNADDNGNAVCPTSCQTQKKCPTGGK